MPDRWGRPTFSDGLNIAQSIMYMQRSNQELAEKQQAKKIEDESFKVFNALQSGEDVSQYSDKAKYLGAKMRWDQDITKLDKQIKELQVSNDGRQQKMLELQEVDAKGKRLYQSYMAARRSGNEALAREIGKKFNNEVAYNGMYVEPGEKGKLKVHKFDGSTQVVDDPPIEFYDNSISGYMNVDPDQMMKRMLSGEQLRMQKNREVIAQAEPMINSKGQIIYKVPAGTWGKDGKPRGAFYVSDPVNQIEIPPEQAKGFKTFDVAKEVRETVTKKPVSPTNVVSRGGQQGLIMQDTSGQASFQPIQGGGGLQTATKPSDAKSQYDLLTKKLETELMALPTDERMALINPQAAIDPSIKMQQAIQIVQKSRQNPDAMTPEEKQALPAATRAMMVYSELQKLGPAGAGGDYVTDTINRYKQLGMQFMNQNQQ